LGTIFAFSPPAALSTTITVANCNDSGAGTLRDAVSTAASGDTIDMSKLTATDAGCSSSTITLKTGGIKISVDDLTLHGPSSGKLTITGNDSGVIERYRIFNHQSPQSTGTLSIDGVTISYGHAVGFNGWQFRINDRRTQAHR
jgi:hypothetical protein